MEWLNFKIQEISSAFIDNSENAKEQVDILVCWNLPPAGWCKLNSNGASKGNPGAASCGGFLRNATGCWIKGYAVNLGIYFVVEAELWGLYYSL